MDQLTAMQRDYQASFAPVVAYGALPLLLDGDCPIDLRPCDIVDGWDAPAPTLIIGRFVHPAQDHAGAPEATFIPAVTLRGAARRLLDGRKGRAAASRRAARLLA